MKFRTRWSKDWISWTGPLRQMPRIVFFETFSVWPLAMQIPSRRYPALFRYGFKTRSYPRYLQHWYTVSRPVPLEPSTTFESIDITHAQLGFPNPMIYIDIVVLCDSYGVVRNDSPFDRESIHPLWWLASFFSDLTNASLFLNSIHLILNSQVIANSYFNPAAFPRIENASHWWESYRLSVIVIGAHLPARCNRLNGSSIFASLKILISSSK